MEEEVRWRTVTVTVVVGAAVLGAWLGLGGRNRQVTPIDPLITATAAAMDPAMGATTLASTNPSSEERTITVHVSGWVLEPGLVRLASDARVADALLAAGGARQDAQLGAINLAAPLQDGVQVAIPGPLQPGQEVSVTGSLTGGPEDGRIRINVATAAELESLPGVGPVLAQRIFDHRNERGPFKVVEDLLDVSGIGESKLASLRDRVALS